MRHNTTVSRSTPATALRAMRAGHHGLHRGAHRRAVKALRFAPTPFGAGGLDSASVEPPGGIYVMSLRSARASSGATLDSRQDWRGGHSAAGLDVVCFWPAAYFNTLTRSIVTSAPLVIISSRIGSSRSTCT